MSQQLVIPNEAKCQKCGLEVKTSQGVYESFGIRMVNRKLLTQAQCKKCRKQSLPKELREKYANYKQIRHEKLHEKTLEVKERFSKIFNQNRNNYKNEQDKITDLLTLSRDKLQREFNADCDKKKQELEASVK